MTRVYDAMLGHGEMREKSVQACKATAEEVIHAFGDC